MPSKECHVWGGTIIELDLSPPWTEENVFVVIVMVRPGLRGNISQQTWRSPTTGTTCHRHIPEIYRTSTLQ